MQRYSAQIMLPQVGEQGQQRLANTHVLVVGAGGLGCPVLSYLAAAGIGHLTLVDPDVLELSNLHRQVLYKNHDIGQYKVDAAAKRLQALNPHCVTTPLVQRLTPANAATLIQQAHIVVDAADSLAVSYILSDACMQQHKPLVSASVLAQQGYVGVFCGGAPSYRAVFPCLPASAAQCSSAGVLGSSVAVLGGMQAHMVLQVALQLQPCPRGILLQVDLQHWHITRINFSTAPEPDVWWQFIAHSQITPADRVIDLQRTPLPPALPLAPQRTILCCRSGIRAFAAAQQLRAAQHKNLYLLAEVAA